jgi:hypothetical protein
MHIDVCSADSGKVMYNYQNQSRHSQSGGLPDFTTRASFNSMQYKGRDSASGIGRKLSIIRPGATTVQVVAP